ncbi:C2 calcium-dependent domain-containing protein 4C-like [Chelmon rostratus]|uniref:C2 calcium-dependent domain-containing protein 4C-like n=1 Tax=Chelmon rostratus TaxID=109905 RepID=UPI001BEC5084|nr:C2 calcium-dependent domain-containing protein 4C-like [Chelmon rostratus]
MCPSKPASVSRAASVIMSAVKSGSSLRSLVLTPERIPDFLIPSRSPLLFVSPRLHRGSPDRTRLLSDHDDDSPGASPPGTPASPAASRLLRLPPPRIRRPRRSAAAAAAESADADTDLTTHAAMSLPHVRKVTTPYGFRAVLAASPCTRRRESLFHQNKPVTLTFSDSDLQDPADPRRPPSSRVCPVTLTVPDSDLQDSADAPPPGRSRVCLLPVKALGLQMMKELRRPVAALKALSPATRKTQPR